MKTEYDLFEILPNRSLVWHAWVRGTQGALEMLKAVGNRTCNECFATDLETREIIGSVNVNKEGRAAQSIVNERGAAPG